MGTYSFKPVAAGQLEVEIREFIGWWKTDQAIFTQRIKDAKPDTIVLNISSLGGFTADALAIHDFLKDYPAEVLVNFTGTSASAATIIGMAGDTIRMSDNALFLVHYNSSGMWAWGTVEALAEAADKAVRALKKHNRVVRRLYAKRTGMGQGELDKLLRLDEWLEAEEALALGFIDEIFEPGEAEDDTAVAHAASARAAAMVTAFKLPEIPTTSTLRTRKPISERLNHAASKSAETGAKPISGLSFARLSNEHIDDLLEDDDSLTRDEVIQDLADVLSEVSPSGTFTTDEVEAFIDEDDPALCPFTDDDHFPTPDDSRAAFDAWAGVLAGDADDFQAAAEADGCSYDDESSEASSAEASSTPTLHTTNTAMPTPKKTTQGQKPETDANASADAELERVRAELAEEKAANAKLLAATRASKVQAVRNAFAGKVTGNLVDAIAELAEKGEELAQGQPLTFAKPVTAAGNGAEEQASFADRLVAIAEQLPQIVDAGVVTLQPVDVDAQNIRALAVQKM